MHGALHHHPLNTHPVNGDEFPSYIISGDLAADVLVGGDVDARVGAQGAAAATVWGVRPNVAGRGGVLAGSALSAAALNGNLSEPRDYALLRGNTGIHGFFRVERDADGGEMAVNAGIQGHVIAPTAISGETAGRVGVQGFVHGSTVTGGLFSGKGGMTIQGDFAASTTTLADFHGPSGIQCDFAASVRTPGGVEFAQTWGPLAGFTLHDHTLHGWKTRQRPVAKALFTGTAGIQGFFRTQLDTVTLAITGDTWLEVQFSAPAAHTTATCTGQVGMQGDVVAMDAQSGLLVGQMGTQGDVDGFSVIKMDMEGGSWLEMEFSAVLCPITPSFAGQIGVQGDVAALILLSGLFLPLDIRVVRGEARFPFVQAGMSTMTFDRDVATLFPGVELGELPHYNPILDEEFFHAG